MMSQYQIIVAEELSPDWAAWFDGMEIVRPTGPGAAGTLLRGKLRDQAALFGVLNRLRDLNLTLIAVRREDETGYTLNIHPAVE
jgi:hypothetical protein